MQSTEKWQPVTGHEGAYEVSDLGRVRSLDRVLVERNTGKIVRRKGRVLKPFYVSAMRYAAVDIGGRTARVHRLVLEAFVGPCPQGMEVLHADSDPANPVLANIRYGTHTENMQQQSSDGRNRNRNKTHCKRGHPFDEKNTYLSRSGRCRNCKTCGQLAYRASCLKMTVAQYMGEA